MKKIKIVTPENIEVEYLLADIGSRTAAALIDFLLQAIVSIILWVAVIFISTRPGQLWDNYEGWVIAIVLLINAIIAFAYFIVMELSMNGVTIGKKVLGLRAIRSNGQPLTLKHSALRNFFRLFLDIFGVGVVAIFFSKSRKRIGDYVASTIVIIEEKKKAPVLLADLLTKNQSTYYKLSPEEQEILREYLARRGSLAEESPIRQEIRTYFVNSLIDRSNEEELKQFIDAL